MAELQRAASWLAAATRITVLTGAGISTDSGIPDFRGPNGVWTVDPGAQRLSTLQRYVADPKVRREAWRNRRAHAAWTAEPNAGHRALVELQRRNTLRAIVTQNVDGLHQRAGSDPRLVIEVHGTVWQAECLGCADRQPMHEVLARVTAGEEDPACMHCGGVLKSATISFGQPLRPQVWQAALSAARECDVFLVVGSSLQVRPVAALCDVAVAAGARLVIVNAAPTPYDGLADAMLREPISQALPALVGAGRG
ncbi:MAG: Sir2 family NAD-dependent protein deacetylase [Jiangellaceae bacterium]|nr:Sir2 family NAD-dependent protein deacetylase [Jiangellaceae bacterium]